LFGTAFFTLANGGMPMLWANLFWIWGHPEVYIVILPAFGIFSEIIATFARKQLFGYKAMVYSIVAISVLSFVVWLHHFFTMGNSAAVNSFFSIRRWRYAVPTGVKIFNWLLTLHRGRIKITTPMLWSLAFIPNFVIGGVTGVMACDGSSGLSVSQHILPRIALPLCADRGYCVCMFRRIDLLVSENVRSQTERTHRKMVLLAVHDGL
jgi:heme/copper-type cytochrome/quinol oxidase subunit 1